MWVELWAGEQVVSTALVSFYSLSAPSAHVQRQACRKIDCSGWPLCRANLYHFCLWRGSLVLTLMLQSSFASSGTSLFAGLEEQSLTRLDGVRHLPSINASTVHRHLLRCCYLLFESRTGSYSPLMCSVYRTINDSSLSQKTVLIVRLRLNWLHPD